MMYVQTKGYKIFLFFLIGMMFNGCSNNEYDGILQKGLDEKFPGIIVGVQDGDESWVGAAGLANIEQEIPMQQNDRFHIASVTKLFTSVAALKLIDENKLSLDSKVDTLLADSLIGNIPNIEDIKVRHLLDHSSGIYSFNNDLRYVNTYIGDRVDENISWTPEKLVDLAHSGDAEPQGKPGTGHYYADTNTILLSLIIENVSGSPFRQHIEKNILNPLQLTNTGFYGTQTDTDDVALSTTVQGYLKESEILNSFIDISPSFERVSDSLLNTTEAVEKIDASAGMVSTASDLLKFGRAVYKEKFLSDESLNWLLSIGDGIENEEMGTTRQGIVTVHKKPYGGLYTSLGDGPGGINSMLAYHPKSDLLVVAFTNIFGNFDEHDFFIDELIPSIISKTSESSP